MSQGIGFCHYCRETIALSGWTFTCTNCNVLYATDRNGQLIHQTYWLQDPNERYSSVVMDFLSNETIVWFVIRDRFPVNCQMTCFIVPQIFSDTLPKDALRLAERLDNLKAFL
jgi:hypothetical protein